MIDCGARPIHRTSQIGNNERNRIVIRRTSDSKPAKNSQRHSATAAGKQGSAAFATEPADSHKASLANTARSDSMHCKTHWVQMHTEHHEVLIVSGRLATIANTQRSIACGHQITIPNCCLGGSKLLGRLKCCPEAQSVREAQSCSGGSKLLGKLKAARQAQSCSGGSNVARRLRGAGPPPGFNGPVGRLQSLRKSRT